MFIVFVVSCVEGKGQSDYLHPLFAFPPPTLPPPNDDNSLSAVDAIVSRRFIFDATE